jgi:hypothetical protein
MLNGTETKPLDKKRLTLKNPKNNKKYNVEFVIVKADVKPILGARAIQHTKLNEIQSARSAEERNKNQRPESTEGQMKKKQIEERFKNVFKGEGKLEGKLHLEIDSNVKPIQLPVRKVPVAVKEKIKFELDRLSDLEIITPVQAPTEFISATVVVMKPDGRIRLCIDRKPLSKALKRNHYPTPTIDEILPELSRP